MRRRWSMGVVVAIAVAVWVALGMGATQPAFRTASAEPVTLALSADSISLRAGGVAFKFKF
jgi:hypothetical protein